MVNWAFQANFQLPWNRTQIPLDIIHANAGYDGSSRSERDVESEYIGLKVTKIKEENPRTDHVYPSNTDAEEVFKSNSRYKTVNPLTKEKGAQDEYEYPYETDTGLYQFYKYVADILNR